MGCIQSGETSKWTPEEAKTLKRLRSSDATLRIIAVYGSEAYCIEVIKALQVNTVVTFIEICNNSDLTPVFCAHAAEWIASNQGAPAVILKIRNCENIGDEGTTILCNAMAKNTVCLEFAIDGGGATSASASAVANLIASNKTLVELNTKRSAWSPEAFQTVADALVRSHNNGSALGFFNINVMPEWTEDHQRIMLDCFLKNSKVYFDCKPSGIPRAESEARRDKWEQTRQVLREKYGADHW